MHAFLRAAFSCERAFGLTRLVTNAVNSATARVETTTLDGPSYLFLVKLKVV
jgi:hypothetical protein